MQVPLKNLGTYTSRFRMGASFLPHIHRTRCDGVSFFIVESAGDDGEDVEIDGVENDPSIGGRTNADSCAGSTLEGHNRFMGGTGG